MTLLSDWVIPPEGGRSGSKNYCTSYENLRNARNPALGDSTVSQSHDPFPLRNKILSKRLSLRYHRGPAVAAPLLPLCNGSGDWGGSAMALAVALVVAMAM